MSRRAIGAAVVVAGLALAGWLYRAPATLSTVVDALEGGRDSTPRTLPAAGVHKCVGAGATTYLDGECPHGMHEVAANGGTLTVASFPKPAPAPSAFASAALGRPLLQPLGDAERDRLRDRQVDDAANRP